MAEIETTLLGKYTFLKIYICAGFYTYKSKTLKVFSVILSPTRQDYLDYVRLIRICQKNLNFTTRRLMLIFI